MNILLISPNTLTAPYPVYPIGLDYVAGSVAAEHTVRIADLNIISLADLAVLLLDFTPHVIGLSCRNIDTTESGNAISFIGEYTNMVAWLRSHSKAVIVCGGSGFTIMPHRMLAAIKADFGVIGDGERFGLLIEAIANKSKPEKIAGIISPLSAAVSTAPEPWQGLQLRDFRSSAPHNHFYLNKGGMLNLQSKRGCAFSCIYCPYPAIEGKKHRLIAPEKVARTALDLEAAGAKYLFITDSAFNSDIPHSLAVAVAFKKAGVTIPWGGFFAPVKLPPDYFTILADAGLSHVEFGTESMSKVMLETYRKPFRVDNVFAAHQQALDAGLHAAHFFLLGGPGENEATLNESLDNIERLNKTVLFFFIGIRIYPGTGLYDIALNRDKITPDTNLLEPVFYRAKAIDPPSIETLVTTRAAKRVNWLVGSGGDQSTATIAQMHDRGFSGPLWEFLVR